MRKDFVLQQKGRKDVCQFSKEARCSPDLSLWSVLACEQGTRPNGTNWRLTIEQAYQTSKAISKISPMKTGLVIVTKDRPAYLRRCLDSLERADLEGVEVVIVDADSQDAETKGLLVFQNHRILNAGPVDIKQCLLTGFQYLIDQGCDLLINLDGDAIVTPDFIHRLTMQCVPDAIYSGFNTGRATERTGPGAFKSTHLNGINMAFSLAAYHSRVLPALQSPGNWDYNVGEGYVLTPSCVQHVGYKSSMGHTGDVDLAIDFPKQLHLPDVTLFGIDSHDKYGIEKAAALSQLDIEFGAVKIITDDLFTPNGTREQRREDYSRFCIMDLHTHFDTSHVLIIHADGWVVNPLAWTDDFLQYDYIGAPWWYTDEMNVGNGGFSLRSKKLCTFLSKAEMTHIHPEDHHICRTYRRSLEKAGFKFAPEDVARKFSVEGQRYNQQFGFHGMGCDFTGADIARVPYRPASNDPVNIAWAVKKQRSERWKTKA